MSLNGFENDMAAASSMTIPSLGKAEILSPLSVVATTDNRTISLPLDEEMVDGLSEPFNIPFELAGPRSRLYFDPSKTKCAVVTCGGLCPGINNVIRSIVMTACNTYSVPSIVGVMYGLKGFMPSFGYPMVELSPERVAGIHEFGGTILGTSRGLQPPEEIVDAMERLNINVLFIIGGDGTMKAAAAIYEEIQKRGDRISVVGIPKTIDNDIYFIPHSFGFETAVDKAVDALRCAHVEASSVDNGIGVVKLMGRESGFIAASSSLALREVSFVLVPEAPFSLHGEKGLLPALERHLAKYRHALLAIAEGAGQHLLQDSPETRDVSGNRILGDFSGMLVNEIKAYFGERGIPHYIKYIDPSYTIRAVPANANDSIYCGFLGQHAVHAAMNGKTGMVVARIMDRYVHLPLNLVAHKRRTMSFDSALWRSVVESTGQDLTV